MKTPNTLFRAVSAAVFAAVICAVTALISIPIPGGGYANPGDAFVLLGGLFLGPVYGALAAGIGSALADLLLGYAVYAPATALIKAGMAALAAFLFLRLKASRLHRPGALAAAALCGEALMVAGYFGYECLLYGTGGALPGLAGNGIQGSVCFCAVFGLYPLLHQAFSHIHRQ